MQSEAGAAGALHGATCTGSLATTFTASQGLLLMIPNMYKLSGELQPCVIHVAARSVAGQALSIFGDHGDVMAARQTGFAIINAADVQESGDMALVAHLATLQTRVPFMNFFDGMRVSHTIEKVEQIPYSEMKKMLDFNAIAEHRRRGFSPLRPYQRGTNQNPDVYMQLVEAANPFYDSVPGAVEHAMKQVEQATGRHYELMQYYGPKDAENVIVAMAMGKATVEMTLDHLNANGKKVGVLMPRLYRPWSTEHLLEALPATTKRITVLDRVKEPGAGGEPLYLDVAASLQGDPSRRNIEMTRGRYGLGQKEFTPGDVCAVVDNMLSEHPMKHFTVGIEDDVTHLSLKKTEEPDVIPKGTVQALVYGFGSDGTVGANKNAIKIIGDNTNQFVQGYFAYGASKAGGLTVSHLRFGPEKFHAYWGVNLADYVACHNYIYVQMYDMLSHIKKGGTFALNSPWTTIEELEKNLPNDMKRQIAEKDLKFYNVDANHLAESFGMGRMINTIMQTAFFRLSGVLPFEEAVKLFKEAIHKSYGAKGEKVVKKNWDMVDAALGGMQEVNYPKEKWMKLESERNAVQKRLIDNKENPEWVREILGPLSLMEGDSIPVSILKDQAIGGSVPMGITQYEKRAVAIEVPEVNMDTCTQCNYCSMSCPHAVIRPFLLDQHEYDRRPKTFDARKSQGGAETAGLYFRIQVSAADCTGCAVCVNACPNDSLRMMSLPEILPSHKPNWEFARSLPDRSERIERNSVKGSQFQQPLFEFSGACAGCGETPYIKLLTQLFGERMIIANATGCSSIYGGPFGMNPYTTRDKDNRGPAWGNSLYEDGAEYGFGMMVTMSTRRKALREKVHELLLDGVDAPVTPELYAQLRKWTENYDNTKVCNDLAGSLQPLLEAEKDCDPIVQDILHNMDLIPKHSMWTIGGDGWAYDIGYGGLDHVLASGQNVNILVLDTEVYSNTGGQSSKSTPMGAIAKFAQGGRETHKKELTQMAMSYGNVYVANVSMGGSMQQTMKAMVEVEAHDGPSVIVAYSPCIEHKNVDGMAQTMKHMADAAHSGYFPLYRYNPQLKKDGKNPFVLDTKKLTVDVSTVLSHENRFAALKRKDPEKFEKASHELRRHIQERFTHLQEMAAGVATDLQGTPLTILYGSETGTTEELASRLATQARQRNYAVTLKELDEMDVDELADHENVMVLCATCGEGDFPVNASGFWEQISKEGAYPADHLKNTRFAVFGLGDSSYHLFNSSATQLDEAFTKLGGQRQQPVGMGNEQDEDMYETELEKWLPDYWQLQEAPEPEGDHLIKDPLFSVVPIDAEETMIQPKTPVLAPNTTLLTVKKKTRLTSEDHDRVAYQVVFDIKGKDVPHLLGDVLTIYSKNDPKKVTEFLKAQGLNPAEVVKVTPQTQVDNRRAMAYINQRSLEQIFTEIVDINGRPNKGFYKELAKFCESDTDKKALELIASDAGAAEYKKLAEETVTYKEVFEMFPSAKMPVEHMLSLIPAIKPRLYSIASSPRFDENVVELAIVILDWKTPGGKVQRGLGTDFIERLKEGDQVTTGMTNGTFEFPVPGSDAPMVMAGLGTGIAPFRAFVQERKWEKDNGKRTGEMWLFYGSRYKNRDFMFGDELTKYQKEGVLDHMENAFSRDQKEKIYVQHRIKQNSKAIYDALVTKKGFFYLCGQAGQTELDIRNSIYESFMEHGNMSMEQAKAEFDKMSEEGRYCPELY
jgi:homodimeric pyruvate:ferredoxin (flavodoxin) oxidoreductase